MNLRTAILAAVAGATILSSCGPKSGGQGDDSLETKKENRKEEKEKKDGVVETRFPNGKLKTRVSYKEGKRHGKSESFYDNGQLCMSEEYVEGRKEGKFLWHHESGTLYKEGEFINGRKNGWEKIYHKNGKLKSKTEFFKGEPTGQFEEYDLDGKAIPKVEVQIASQSYNRSTGMYTLKIRLSKSVKSFDAYLHPDNGSGGLQRNEMEYMTDKGQEASVSVKVPSGSALIGKFHVRVDLETFSGAKYEITKVVDINTTKL